MLDVSKALVSRAVSPEVAVEVRPWWSGGDFFRGQARAHAAPWHQCTIIHEPTLVASRCSLALQPTEASCSYMLTTYLDETLRVTRDEDGHVYVMLRDVQASLDTA